MHTLLVTTHVLTAVVALVTGVAAFVSRDSTPRHRMLGKAYVGGWIGFATTGLVLGASDPIVSVFEVLTGIGAVCVGLGLCAAWRRKAIGSGWLHQHYQWMITSLAFVVVATVNQLLIQAGWPPPVSVFIGLTLLPFGVIPPIIRGLDHQYETV